MAPYDVTADGIRDPPETGHVQPYGARTFRTNMLSLTKEIHGPMSGERNRRLGVHTAVSLLSEEISELMLFNPMMFFCWQAPGS
jgi:hypothetical protein